MNNDKIFILVMRIIFGIMYIAIVAALIWEIVQVNKEFFKETTEEVQLYSISTDKEYEGSFVLGSGSIDSQEYITAYRITEDGGKKYFKMNRDKVTIYDTLNNDEQAYAEIKRASLGIKEIKLYVPKNTIEKEINLNL
jgi:hypothetical protein